MLVITRRRGIEQSVSPTVPANSARGLAPTVNGTNPVQGLEWPLHSPSYGLGPPALPGHAGYGMDSRGGWGRDMATPATTVIFVNSNASNVSGSALSSSTYGGTTFAGTWRYAWQHTAQHKIIIPLVGGYIQIGDDPNSAAEVPFMTYCGQFAPRPGLVLRQTNPRVNGGSDQQIWHLRSYQGDDPSSSFPVGIRDCMAIGRNGSFPSRVVAINCELAWGLDELLDSFYGVNGMTLIYCAFIEPLHAPPLLPHPEDPVGTDHGFGPILGGGAQPANLCTMRNLWAHTTARNPLTSATTFVHANNLHYNHGRPGGGNGNGVHWHATNSAPMLANVLGNLFIRGPQNTSSMVAVACQVGVSSGSGCFLSKNVQHGWSAPSSQNAFLTSAPGGFVQSTYRPTALPSFWGDAALTGVLDLAANPLAPTLAEINDFIDLMEDSVGTQPGWRDSNAPSRVDAMFSQIRARLTGGSTGNQMVDTVAQAGGWFDLDNVGPIDPLNPGTHWHAPFPTTNRDQVLTSGSLLNGMSAVGYTRLEAWALNQHYYVGGK